MHSRFRVSSLMSAGIAGASGSLVLSLLLARCPGCGRRLQIAHAVQATAAAIVDCTSTDVDAFECATVTASAKAFADATATAHANACAGAGCPCLSDSLRSFGSTDTFAALVSEASATATASACISGVPHSLLALTPSRPAPFLWARSRAASARAAVCCAPSVQAAPWGTAALFCHTGWVAIF